MLITTDQLGGYEGESLDVAEAVQDPPTFEEAPHLWANQESQLRFMRRVVDTSRALPEIRATARDIVFRLNGCKEYDKRAHAIAIGRWVQRNVTYVNELPEIFQTPIVTLTQRYGDCEDKSMLTAALLESIGIPVVVMVVSSMSPSSHREAEQARDC